MLLLRVAQEMYPDGSEEVLATLGLFSRLVTFNKVIYMVDSVIFQIYPYKLFKSVLSTGCVLFPDEHL